MNLLTWVLIVGGLIVLSLTWIVGVRERTRRGRQE